VGEDIAAVAKLLCVLKNDSGAEVKWRWMRAVRLIGMVEGRGRWEKRAADLNGSRSKQKVSNQAAANVSYNF
jgi:hypothetical protein